MLNDLNRIGPVLALAIVAALLLVWDFLPEGGPLPRARGKPLMLFALLGPAAAALWTAALLASGERNSAFAGSAVLDDTTYFFFFLFVGVTAAVILASEDYAKRFGDYEAEFFALLLFATSAMLLLS